MLQMTEHQIDIAAIRYVSKKVKLFIDAPRHQFSDSVGFSDFDDLLAEGEKCGVRFVNAFFCPAGEKGPVQPQEGLKLTSTGTFKKASWQIQAPWSREGAEFKFGNLPLRIIRGLALESRLVPVRMQEPGRAPRLVLYWGMFPGESSSSKHKTQVAFQELKWRRNAPATVYVPRVDMEQGWSNDDLSAQIAWWASSGGIAASDTDRFIKRYANRIWPPGEDKTEHGPSCLFDGSFKAPLSPLAIKAHVSYCRRLSLARRDPSVETTYPAKVNDMAYRLNTIYHLDIGERMLYRDAEAGNIPCEIIEGIRGREIFFHEDQEPQIEAYYQERRQRKAIIAGWKKARGITDNAAREWVRTRLQLGETLDDLEKIVRDKLKAGGCYLETRSIHPRQY